MLRFDKFFEFEEPIILFLILKIVFGQDKFLPLAWNRDSIGKILEIMVLE